MEILSVGSKQAYGSWFEDVVLELIHSQSFDHNHSSGIAPHDQEHSYVVEMKFTLGREVNIARTTIAMSSRLWMSFQCLQAREDIFA